MGLSSSQGRLLMLTARLSDIELQETTISQRQAQLALSTEKAAKAYNSAMNNYKLVIKVTDKSEDVGYVKQDLNYSNMTKMGYLLVDANNNLYLQKDEDGNWIIPKDIDGKDLLTIDSKTGKAVIGKKQYNIADGTQHISDAKILQNSIMTGSMFLVDVKNEKDDISISNLESNTEMQYILDTSDDAEAQSKYEYETAKLARQDNKLEMDIKQLETEHEAILKEYEAVKDVIKNNVNRTYNLFSNG